MTNLPLTPSERTTFKTEIAKRLSPRSWVEIDLVLEEFGATIENSWSGDEFSYVVAMLRGADDEKITQLAAHLNVETGQDSIFEPPSFWVEGRLRVFISHLSKNKVFASDLQAEMAKLGISGFVAHEDIEPDEEWQSEIERALRTCDALVALLHDGFNESTWTDQEVGYALGRGVPVFSVRLDMSPYGLFGKKQAFNGKGKELSTIANELHNSYLKHPKTQDHLCDQIVASFCNSSSFAIARDVCTSLENLPIWKSDYTKNIRSAVDNNSQIASSWGVPERVTALIKNRDPAAFSQNAGDIDDDIPF